MSKTFIRRRRLARLGGFGASPSSVSPPATPISQSPNGIPVSHGPSPSVYGSSSPTGDKAAECMEDDTQTQPSSAPPPQSSDSETSSIHMEVDEVSAEKAGGGNTDIDSGIENMEVEEGDVKRETNSRQRTSSSTEMSEEQLQASVSRVLLSIYSQPSAYAIHLPETAEAIRETPNISLPDLISSSLMEMLIKIKHSESVDLFAGLKARTDPDNASVGSFSASPAASPGSTPVVDNRPQENVKVGNGTEVQGPDNIAFNYLMECYVRVRVEERNHPKKSSVPPFSDLLSDLRSQIIYHSVNIMRMNDAKNKAPLLVRPLINQTLQRGFLTELVLRTHTNF